jgi:serine/tyrosine/threonine adenylyltransferase
MTTATPTQTAPPTTGFPFDNSYARLPEGFFAVRPPTPVPEPRLIRFNHGLAAELGLDTAALDEATLAEIFAGNRLPEGALPIAMAYAGHQFGQFVPQLGDGRAILLGEVVGRDGRRRDIQFKGAGRTPYSRGGDGRAPLGPVLREYLVSEAMHALGIPTTRALAAVTTGEPVMRQTIQPGAVITRVAASHVRIGTFQFFAARGMDDATKQLADYVIARHYPEIAGAERPYLGLLEAVRDRQAALVARWLLVGFIHGVMNTDNMSIAGETIDFGPCAFMDAYDPATVFSSIDEFGRYAYGNQPRIAQWNLARFAEAILQHLDPDEEKAIEFANGAITGFWEPFQARYLAGMREKLGLASAEEGDLDLAKGLLDAMEAGRADFTLTFRRLAALAAGEAAEGEVQELFAEPGAIISWLPQWQARLARDPLEPAERGHRMRLASPAVIPRNHLVEEALEAAIARDDYGPFDRLHAALARPYVDDPKAAGLAAPPPPSEVPYRTFCGT